METPQIEVVRAYAPKTVLRAVDDTAAADNTFDHVMEVRFSTFNTWYEIDSWWEGEFLERTVKGAFAETIVQDRDAIKVLYDHGFDYQIGNKVLGPIDDLREDPDSPVGEVPLFDTQYNRELLPGLEAGVYGSSFRMRVTGETWDDEPGVSAWNPRGLPERTITKVRLFEFGPVTFPANPESTASMRSLTDAYYERLMPREPQAYDAALRAIGRSRPDFTGRPGARSTGGGGTDVEPQGGDTSLTQANRDRALRWAQRRMKGQHHG
ncbi:HK97 family phage prohead protease [Kribbella sp. NPDC051718]|uniref:HK97 family phage prohead protease n=1 Tax=Kribbella sp. NPDC051718 TaxID=3155168 RepID=UPI00341BAA68